MLYAADIGDIPAQGSKIHFQETLEPSCGLR